MGCKQLTKYMLYFLKNMSPLISCTSKRSDLYFDKSLSTDINEPALQRLLTLQFINLISFFCSSCGFHPED